MNTRMGNPGGVVGLPRVVVTGATASKFYDGEGHVVGPCGSTTSAAACDGTTGSSSSKPAVTPITLGTTDFYVGGLLADGDLHDPNGDAFLYSFDSTKITFQFYDIPFDIRHVGFDWEIFPEVGNAPDLKLKVDGVPIFHYYGFTPGSGNSGPVIPGIVTPGASPYTESRCTDRRTNAGNDGPFEGEAVASPCTPPAETFFQLIGSTGLIDLRPFMPADWTGATKFEFIDWPPTIGIDNFYMPPPPEVPEPASLLLLGTGLLGIGRQWRKKRQNRNQNIA